MTRMFRFKNRGRLTCLAALLLLVGVSGSRIMQAQTQVRPFVGRLKRMVHRKIP